MIKSALSYAAVLVICFAAATILATVSVLATYGIVLGIRSLFV